VSQPAPIYLDHAATTPLREEVAEAITAATVDGFGNPSSPHAAGRRAKQILEEARERILALLGAHTSGGQRDRLVFTSGATEANRLALLGAGAAAGPPGLAITSARDHLSIRSAVAELGRRGWSVAELPLAPAGTSNGQALAAMLSAGAATRRIVAVTLVCSQTGIREDRASVSAVAAAGSGLVVHADATQAVAWEPLEFAASPFAAVALAPHKFGGPRGIGGLVVRGGTVLAAQMPGPQELGLRGGTEAVPLAAGFARALELAAAERAETVARVVDLKRRLEAGILAAAAAAGLEARVIGADGSRAPHIATIGIAGTDRQAIVMAADLAGLCLATGTACASGSSEPAAALVALGIEERVRQGAIRASLGRTTTASDIDGAVARLGHVFCRLRP